MINTKITRKKAARRASDLSDRNLCTKDNVQGLIYDDDLDLFLSLPLGKLGISETLRFTSVS
jgi:hypothetical protein